MIIRVNYYKIEFNSLTVKIKMFILFIPNVGTMSVGEIIRQVFIKKERKIGSSHSGTVVNQSNWEP